MIIIPKRTWDFPRGYEHSYVKMLRAYVSYIEAAMRESIPDMQKLAEAQGVKFDSYESDLTALLNRIGAKVDRKISEAALKRRVQQMYNGVDAFNESEFRAVIKDAVGIDDFFINERWQEMYKAVWVQDNLNLIRSIKQSTMENIRYKLGDMVLNAQGKQLRAAQLSEMVQEIAHVNKNRADLIARDQIGKLNGRLTQLRQTGAGINRYRWSTSRDERVRPAHAEREGKIFEWDNPPPDGNPGYPIRCRCVARPVIDTAELGISTTKSVKIKEENAALPNAIAGVKRGEPMSEKEANEGRPNPNYGSGYEYKVNCQSCVVTYEARRRGYNVETMPNFQDEDSTICKLSHDTRWAWIDPITKKEPQFIPHPSAKNVKAYMKWLDIAVESGKRYTLQVVWKGKELTGHIVHIRRNSDNKLEIYDPQVGDIYSYGFLTDTRTGKTYKTGKDMVEWFLKKVRFTSYGRWCGPELLRVDDKEFNMAVVNEIMRRYGGDE